MRTDQATMTFDRLLYGPDKPDLELSTDLRSKTPLNSTSTIPTNAVSSPTASHKRSILTSPTCTTASPVEFQAESTEVADGAALTDIPYGQTSRSDESTTPSPTSANLSEQQSPATTAVPTLATNSPVDFEAKQQYYVHAAHTETPTSTTAPLTSALDSKTKCADRWSQQRANQASEHADRQPVQPALKPWQIWRRPPAIWHPTVWQIRPMVGIFGLCVAVACALASLSVLIVSDGQAQAAWPVAPSVLLAAITAVANSAIALAYMEAVPISFWYSLTRGRTIRSLERQWQISRSIVFAVAKLRYVSVLNMACIAVALVVIDGPLLQRASTVVRATQAKNVTLDIVMTPEIPLDFTGTVTNHLLTIQNGTLGLLMEYTTDDPMHINVEGCDGKCAATVQGPGVHKTDCWQQVWPITPETLRSDNASWGEWRTETLTLGTPSTILPAFEVSVTPIYNLSSSAALLKVGLASWIDQSYAISEYDVSLEGGVVTIPKTPRQGRVLRVANNTKAVDQSIEAMPRTQNSAMDAVTVDIDLVVHSNVSAIRAAGSPPNTIYAVYSLTHSLFSAQHVYTGPGSADTLGDTLWHDPTEDILFVANSLMFRAGAMSLRYREHDTLATLIDPGVSINQTVGAVQEVTQNVYKSDLRWYAGAAIVQIATVLITLPMFWGWWRLGCDLTLSPFSVALAFDSPVLSDVNSAAGAKGVVDRLGGTKLRYGAVGPDGEGANGTGFDGRLGVAESHAVLRPRAGMAFKQ